MARPDRSYESELLRMQQEGAAKVGWHCMQHRNQLIRSWPKPFPTVN